MPDDQPDARRARLRPDCTRCVGLCCVGLEFEASAHFAFDKPAGQPCRNLLADHRCRIHEHLGSRGFQGCVVFDCQGAGQQVTQVTMGGRDWRREPDVASEMFTAFAFVRQLHELLWYLTEVVTLPAARPLRDDLARALDETDRYAHLEVDALMLADLHTHRTRVTELLLRTSELVRAAAGGDAERAELPGADLAGRDLTDARLRGANLRQADLRDSCLRGADLRGADLRTADLRRSDLRGADLGQADLAGADLRDADVRGADLGSTIYLTQYQVNTANGDASTRLPPPVLRPPHWP